MAFSAADIEQLIAVVQGDAALRERLRDAILRADLVALTGIVARLGDRLEGLAERVEDLAAADRALGERMDQLTGRIDQLTEQVKALTVRLAKMDGRLGNLEGDFWEFRYTSRLSQMLGQHHFIAVRQILPGEYPPFVEAWRDGRISDDEWHQLNLLDAVATAKQGKGLDAPDVMIALELSKVVDSHDVNRVNARASILRRAGFAVVAAVDGAAILPGAKEEAVTLGVLTLVRRDTETRDIDI
jgi:hypothetical protein